MMNHTRLLTRMVGTSLRTAPAVRVTTNIITKPLFATYIKQYSTQNKDANKSNKQTNSILTEDLLAKAGFEDPNTESKESSESGEPGETKSEDSTRSSRRKRRAQTSKDLQRERAANWFYILSFIGAGAGVGYLSRNWDSEAEQKSVEGTEIANGYSPQLMYERLNKRLASLFTFFSEPAFESLLPPPAPEAYRRPLTLVLTLDDLLVHSSWDSKNGWRTAKRPGLDYFLRYLSQYYEIVIFASNYEMYSEGVVKKLDPMQAAIQFALFREGCRYKDGKLIKDLSLLNRDLAKTVIVEVDEDAVSLQRENAILAKKWEGQADDYLVSLIPFLEYLATQPSKDVRPILGSFQDRYNIVEEFRERELKLRAKWKAENSKPNAGNFLASMLGAPALAKEPKMPLDIIREHGQFQYEQYEKYVEANIAKALEEEQKMKDVLGKTSLNKFMNGGPSPEEIARVQKEIQGQK